MVCFMDSEEDMSNSYSSLCDSFCFDMSVNTELDPFAGKRLCFASFDKSVLYKIDYLNVNVLGSGSFFHAQKVCLSV